MQLRHECWALTTGEAGMRSQALGLADALGLPVVEKRLVVPRPWGWLPAGLLPVPLAALSAKGDRLEPPWPLVVIGCGRRSIGPALAVKRASGGRTLAAYVQNPEFGGKKFDLVVALPHDGVRGANVLEVGTALHTVTPERLQAGATEWRTRLNPDGRPLLGVLVGGDNPSYRLSPAVLGRLVAALRDAHERGGYRAVLTPSRRTGDDALAFLGAVLADAPWADIWDRTGENPYLGILGLADRLIVTGESISMISEALATGRPVHVLRLEGEGRRHEAFLSRIVGEGMVSILSGDALDLAFAGRPPSSSMAEPARHLRAMLVARGVAGTDSG